MTDGGILILLLVAAFCVGIAIFARVIMHRGARAGVLGWAFCGIAVTVFGWGAFWLDAGRAAAIFTGFVLPAWLMGGLIGLLAGAVMQRLRK